jgi:hypothetical protein
MTTEELDNLIKDCQHEMKEWYGVEVSDEAAEDFITRHEVESFDTLERSIFINYIARISIGMDWPCNGDSQEYKDEFFKKFYGLDNQSDIKWERVNDNIIQLPQTRCFIWDGMFIRTGFFERAEISRVGTKTYWYDVQPPFEKDSNYEITHYYPCSFVRGPKL